MCELSVALGSIGCPGAWKEASYALCQEPWSLTPKAFIPHTLNQWPAGSKSSYHLLSSCVGPISSVLLRIRAVGLHSSWPGTPAGFEWVMTIKTSLKVWCWLATTFCWMCVWGFSVCWHDCANVLPSLKISGSLLSRCCCFPFPRNRQKHWELNLPFLPHCSGRKCVLQSLLVGTCGCWILSLFPQPECQCISAVWRLSAWVSPVSLTSLSGRLEVISPSATCFHHQISK